MAEVSCVCARVEEIHIYIVCVCVCPIYIVCVSIYISHLQRLVLEETIVIQVGCMRT